MTYLDHAATTPLRREALEAMWPFLTEVQANPASTHEPGRLARTALDAAREDVAAVLGCRPDEVHFTSGGTEANNLALQGLARAGGPGSALISAVEHASVREAATLLTREGTAVGTVPVDDTGTVLVEPLGTMLAAGASVCSVMLANNEVGTVQPVAAVAERCRATRTPLHVDAVQAPGLLPLDVGALGADALSLSGHKFGGPRGTGVLYVRSGLPLVPVLAGGGQEGGVRPGTVDVAGAVGLATALRLAEEHRLTEAPRLAGLQDQLVRGVLAVAPGAVLTGHPTRRLPSIASFCFVGRSGESLLVDLDARGVACSSGSACSSEASHASPVLVAMGYDEDVALSAVRFSLGRSTTAVDIERAIVAVADALGAPPRAATRLDAAAPV